MHTDSGTQRDRERERQRERQRETETERRQRENVVYFRLCESSLHFLKTEDHINAAFNFSFLHVNI